MKQTTKLTIGLMTLVSASPAMATTVQTCTMDYSGVINTVDVDNGVVTGIAKLFAKQSDGESFTLVAKNGNEYTRSGTITTTVDLTQFSADGESCNFDNRFTPAHSISEKSPWRQFQMRFDSYYDSNIMARYDHNGIESKLMVANGWTWGTDMAGIHVFEFINGEFFPVKYDVDQGNGELPAFKAGDKVMSMSGDGGLWQYRASAVSDDGRLVAGYAKLEESVRFEQGFSISSAEKFGMVWEIAESCDVDSSKCAQNDASRLTSGSQNSADIAVRSISGSQITRNSGVKAKYSNGENLTYTDAALGDGQVISYDSIPESFTIGYRFTHGADEVICTLMDAEGALTQENKRERVDPYLIYGESNSGTDQVVYNTRDKSLFEEGELKLTIHVFPDRECKGESFYSDTITVTINKTDNTSSPGTPAIVATEVLSGEFYLVDVQEEANNFEMLSFDPDSTMESVYGITTIESGKYMVNGRSASGKAMVALVTL